MGVNQELKVFYNLKKIKRWGFGLVVRIVNRYCKIKEKNNKRKRGLGVGCEPRIEGIVRLKNGQGQVGVNQELKLV